MIILASTGYITVHAYTSYAQLPLEDVAISITSEDGTAIAMRLTDRSGRITPVEVPVPERSESQAPGVQSPFTLVTIHARLKGYAQVQARNVQLFAGTTTLQNLEMIPLSELPDSRNKVEIFPTPPQNL